MLVCVIVLLCYSYCSEREKREKRGKRGKREKSEKREKREKRERREKREKREKSIRIRLKLETSDFEVIILLFIF